MKKNCCAAVLVLFAFTSAAKDYLITNRSVAVGEKVQYVSRTFTGGENILSSLQQIPNVADEGDNFYFEPGDYYGDVTIATPKVSLLGANANREDRTATRISESVIRGTITVNASGVLINGFAFTGAGCVTNTSATPSSPIDGFNFAYNKVYGSTVAKERFSAVLRLGVGYTGDAAKNANAHRRYNNVGIRHNTFEGSASAVSNFVVVSGSYGSLNINDNTFTDGGTSICVANAQNTVNIRFNNFKNVGSLDRTIGTVTGEFCVFLEYLAYANSTTVNIQSNVFDNCNGQSSMYCPIRFFQGDSSTPILTPQNCRVNVNYNLFLNKTKHSSANYNYVFYGNDTYNTPAVVDSRFNRYSNSEYCMGNIKQPKGDSASRYFASSTELFDFASSKGTTLDYYTNAAGGEMKNFNITASTRVAQSFDIDDTTGDIYFAQICPNSQSGLSLSSDEPLAITRVYKNSSGGVSQQRMYLDYAGHGSNMAVCKYNGTLYIITGGKSLDTSTSPSYDGIKCQACSFVPFVAGAVADCRKDSFTYGGKTYTINYFKNKFGRNFQYPTIDRDNRLYCERSTSGDVYYGVYDLDEVFTKWSDAEPLNVVPVKKLTNKTTYVDDSSNIDELDQGFQTWDHQGFTISGDYIYHCEGVGRNNSAAATKDGSKIPTIMLHVFNWRTGELAYRKPVMKSTILNLDDGEPEGVKVHRDSKGRPHLLLGVVTGASGNRKANIFRYSLDETSGLNSKIKEAVITASTSAMNFVSTDGGEKTATFTVTRSSFYGTPTFTRSGEDADNFSVTCDKTSWLTATNTVTVTYKPDARKKEHTAKVRVSSAYAKDYIITLTGRNDSFTAVESVEEDDAALFTISADKEIVPQENCEDLQVFDLTGRPVSGSLTTGIYLVKASANGRSTVKKIAIR
ncbi:MAG: hypothetical protein ACI31F_07260 [Muribaculaceae bacterium]